MLRIAASLTAGTTIAITGITLWAAAGSAITGTVSANGAPLTDAIVYVQHADGTFNAPNTPATLNQRGMKFVPHVLPLVVGTTVRFLNNDTTQHNVFSPDNEKYNLATWPQGSSKKHVFAKCAKPPCAY